MSTAGSKSAATDALSNYSECGRYPLARLDGDTNAPDSRDGFLWDVTHYANLWFKQPDHNDIEEFLTQFPPFYDWDYLDNKAMWHRNATPVYAAFSAHCLRLIRQWKHETALHRYLSEKPFFARGLGFDGIPSQDQLWKDWNRYFSEEDREKVFEAGYSTATDGTGFDLPIVSRVADAHGWMVQVNESATDGARFDIIRIMSRSYNWIKMNQQEWLVSKRQMISILHKSAILRAMRIFVMIESVYINLRLSTLHQADRPRESDITYPTCVKLAVNTVWDRADTEQLETSLALSGFEHELAMLNARR